MENIILKDGTEAFLDIWNFKDLESYVSSQKLRKEESRSYYHVKGFRFLSNTAVQNLLYRGEHIFTGKNLSPMEKQVISGLAKEKYVNSIVALCDDKLIGIMVCNWVRDSNFKTSDLRKDQLPFWRYFTEFLNVHDDYQNMGVGTAIIKYLDDSKFLDNKILQLSVYNENGTAHAKPIVERELKAANYALIPHDYSVKLPPTEPGIYDRMGKLKKK